MLHFLKKRLGKSRKSSQKLAPLENPTYQTIDTDAECGRDSDGEYRSGEISELMKPMGFIMALDINDGGGSRVATCSGRIEDRRLSAPNASTLGLIPGHHDGDASECGQF